MSGETPEVTLLRGLAGTARGPRREGVFALWLTTRAALDLLIVPPPAERSHRRRITALERRLATLTLPPPLRRALNASLTQLRTSSPESALEALTQLIAPARETGGPDAGEALAAAARAARDVLRTRKAQG
ncbi:MAG: hypothetical protein AB7I33_12850 [Gemmatimonadales bacterium]